MLTHLVNPIHHDFLGPGNSFCLFCCLLSAGRPVSLCPCVSGSATRPHQNQEPTARLAAASNNASPSQTPGWWTSSRLDEPTGTQLPQGPVETISGAESVRTAQRRAFPPRQTSAPPDQQNHSRRRRRWRERRS